MSGFILTLPPPAFPAVHAPWNPSIPTMNTRFYCFCAATWAAAAILILGNGAMSTDVLSAVVALAGFDLLRP